MRPQPLKLDITIRGLNSTMLLAAVLAYLLIFVVPDYFLALLFVILWSLLFFSWPPLSRRLGFPNFPKPPVPANPRPAVAARLAVTAVLATVLAVGLARWIDAGVFVGITLVPFGLALYYGSPYLTRQPGFSNLSKAQASAPPAPKRPSSLRTIRSTLRSVATTALALVLLLCLVSAPVCLSFYRARTAYDAVHIGMTVPEVLHAVTNCELFRASSEFPHDDNADAANIPAMNLGRGKDGVYQVYDIAARQNVQLSEPEVIERLHAKLHDGYRWHFYYTYTNIDSADVYFSVVIGPDGRVTEVEPVRGLD